jgi:hypothetical protein
VPYEWLNQFYFQQCLNILTLGLTSLSLPEGLNTIREYVFFFFANLVSVSLPASFQTIGAGSFVNCSSLTTVIIPDAVKSIAFESYTEVAGGGMWEPVIYFV